MIIATGLAASMRWNEHSLGMEHGAWSRRRRTLCLNLREAWAKRRYGAHFISKLTDCDGENSETDSSLDFARDCGFLTLEQHCNLTGICKEVGKIFGSMISNPGPFLIS